MSQLAIAFSLVTAPGATLLSEFPEAPYHQAQACRHHNAPAAGSHLVDKHHQWSSDSHHEANMAWQPQFSRHRPHCSSYQTGPT